MTEGTSEKVPAAQGPKGDKGDKGKQGIQGVQGIQGKPAETEKIKAVVVSDDCPHCKEIKEYIKSKGLDVKMINVSTPDGLKFAKDHGINAVPECVVVERDGKQVKVCTKEEFEKLLEDGK